MNGDDTYYKIDLPRWTISKSGLAPILWVRFALVALAYYDRRAERCRVHLARVFH